MSNREILITPSRILVQHKQSLPSGNWWETKFDTDLDYLKTDPQGQFKAGGYEKCPTFYGSGSDPAAGITDKDNGWWPTDLISGSFNYANSSNILLDTPNWTTNKVYYQFPVPASGNSYNPAYSTYDSTYKNLYIGTSIVGTFKWRAATVVVGNDGENDIYNVIVLPVEIALDQPNISGVLKFTWQDISTWTGYYLDSETGAPVATNFYNAHNFDADGTRYWRFSNPIWNPWCLMFIKNPSTLSLAVTP